MGLRTFIEGDIELALPESAIRLDAAPKSTPQGMKLVDFCFHASGTCYLIEVKDPSHPRAGRNQMREIKKLKGKELINSQLAPKARGSYTWLHLMEEDTVPIVYIVLLGTSALRIEKPLLVHFQDRLRKQIEQEPGMSWRRRYIKAVIVVTDLDWNKVFRRFGWQLRRQSAAATRE